MDGMLSQEEINALLSGMDTGSASSEETEAAGQNDTGGDDNEQVEEILTQEEKDAMHDQAHISMGKAATTLSSLVNNVVDITVPRVCYAKWDELVDA